MSKEWKIERENDTPIIINISDASLKAINDDLDRRINKALEEQRVEIAQLLRCVQVFNDLLNSNQKHNDKSLTLFAECMAIKEDYIQSLKEQK